MAKRGKNIRLETALDGEILEAMKEKQARIDVERKKETDKLKLEKMAKKYARVQMVIRRVNTRIANRLAGPKEETDLSDLLD